VSSTTGVFGAVQTLSGVSKISMRPQVAVNASGKAIVIWTRLPTDVTSQVEGAVGP